MKVFNYGSINVDHIYRIKQFVRPGETLAADEYRMTLGGKGANQSIALAKAGVTVQHIGRISTTDDWVLHKLQSYGIGDACMQRVEEPTGHAIIQVTDQGENAILLYGGANQSNNLTDLNQFLSHAGQNDWLLLQNECNLTAEALQLAKQQGMTVAFNPAPMTAAVREMPLDCVDYLIVNELEAQDLVNDAAITAEQPDALIKRLHTRYPNLNIVLTLGEKGVMYQDANTSLTIPAEKVEAIDTTAAGDTFIGYFIQQRIAQEPIKKALTMANRASALAVQTLGASDSIPDLETLLNHDFT